MKSESFNTLILTVPEMEYKYVLIAHRSSPMDFTIRDLDNGVNTTSFGVLFEAGWIPQREIPLGGGGDSSGASILVLLTREKKCQNYMNIGM